MAVILVTDEQFQSISTQLDSILHFNDMIIHNVAGYDLRIVSSVTFGDMLIGFLLLVLIVLVIFRIVQSAL